MLTSPVLAALLFGEKTPDLGAVEEMEPESAQDATVNHAVRITHAERRRARDLCAGCAPSRAELPCLQARAQGEPQAETAYDDPSTGLDPRAVALSCTERQARAVLDSTAFFTSPATP
jgi:hypothetical protein